MLTLPQTMTYIGSGSMDHMYTAYEALIMEIENWQGIHPASVKNIRNLTGHDIILMGAVMRLDRLCIPVCNTPWLATHAETNSTAVLGL